MWLLVGVALAEYASRIDIKHTSAATEYSGLTFTNSGPNSYWGGAAVHIEVPTPKPDLITLKNCHFINIMTGVSTGQETGVLGGGAVFFDRVNLKCDTCEFMACMAKTGRGGAILCYVESEADIVNCIFEDCKCRSEHATINDQGGGALAVQEKRLSVTGSTFSNCTCPEADGGAIVVSYRGNKAPSCLFRECKFEECAAKGTGAIRIGLLGVTNVEIDDCKFFGCSSDTATAVFESTSDTPSVTITKCDFVDCTGNASNAVLSIVNCETLTFEDNNFSLALESDKLNAIYVYADRTMETMKFVRCYFSNNGKRMGKSLYARSGFLKVKENMLTPPDYTPAIILNEVWFDNCTFEDIVSEGEAGGISLSIWSTDDARYIYILGCNFTRLVGAKAGAILACADENNFIFPSTVLVMKECIIESCQGNDVGGVCVDTSTRVSLITNCTFISNSGGGGQSILLKAHSDLVDQGWLHVTYAVISDCTFQGHEAGEIIRTKWERKYVENVGWQDVEKLMDCGLIITGCVFENNHLGASNLGLVYSHTKNITIQLCEFNDNSADEGLIGICPYYNLLEIIGCAFNSCKTKSTGIIIPNSTEAEDLRVVCLANNFSDCTCEESALLFDSENLDMTLGFLLQGCIFENCQGSGGKGIMNGPITICWIVSCSFTGIKGTCLNLAVPQPVFSLVYIEATRQADVPVVAVRATGTGFMHNVTINTTVDGALPQTAGASLDLQVESKANVTIADCCFNSPLEVHDKGATGLYLKLAIAEGGVCTLASTCFDTDEATAIEVVSGTPTFEGNRTSFFGDCFCSAERPSVEPPPEPEPVPTEPPIPTDPSEDGNKSNAGLIAGIVIALLVVIAVIVVLLFFFVIRPRRKNTSSTQEEDRRYDDEPEVTITTINDTQMNEWETVTEENAPFAAPSEDRSESPFANAFEEKQFY